MSVKLANTKYLKLSMMPVSSLVIADLEMWRYFKAGKSLRVLAGMSLMLEPSILINLRFFRPTTLGMVMI